MTMSWASYTIEKLKKGETVQIRPRGNSMKGKIESGNLVTIEPAPTDLKKGDVVLCRVKGRDYLHLVTAVSGNRYLIGNNRGGTNGWVGKKSIFGRAIKVEA